ncbi:MAG: hypothetical protein ACW99A_10635 [Candidatus Kariarchaeaceae archaeon]
MARKKIWKDEVELTSKLPIDITMPKAYVLANTPYNEDHWTRTFLTSSDEIVVARATQQLPLSRDIQLTVESQNSLSNSDYETIVAKMRHELGLDEKMGVLKKLKEQDTLIDIALQSNPGFRLFANSDAVEVAILTILSQNTSFFTYLDIVEKLLEKHGTPVPWDKSLNVFPSKSKISAMEEKDWLELKLGYKAKYLSSFNEDTLHDIETFSYYPILERGLEQLRKIIGIGHYTSRILAIYHSRRYSFPFYDTYVLEVLNHKYEIGNINNQRQFDNWVYKRWPKDPALVIHSLLLEYLPEFLRSHKTFYSKDESAKQKKTKKKKITAKKKKLVKIDNTVKPKITSTKKKKSKSTPKKRSKKKRKKE